MCATPALHDERRERQDLRQRGTVPAETLIESVASVLAGNVNGLRIKKIEATDAARNVDGYERAMDALRARRAVVSHGRR